MEIPWEKEGYELKYLRNIKSFWKCTTFTTYKKIADWFKNSDIYGKKIKHIYTTADVLFLNRGHFIDIYNNSRLREGKSIIMDYWDEFDFSFISPDRTISRYIQNGGPMVFVFEDDSTFEFYSSDYGVYHMAENALKSKLNNLSRGNINVEKMFHNLVGTSIVGIELIRYQKSDYEYRYVNKFKAPKDQVFAIRLKLNNGTQLFLKNQAFALEKEDGTIDPIRFEEFLDCIYDKEKCLTI